MLLLRQLLLVQVIPSDPRPSSSPGSSPAGCSLAVSPATWPPAAASLTFLPSASVLLPVALWKRPYLAPAVLLGAAVLVEQRATIPSIPITDRIPLFHAVGPGHLEGADILLLMALFIYLVKGKEWGTRLIPRTHVSLAIRAVLACVALAIVVGHAHHGRPATGLNAGPAVGVSRRDVTS